MPPNMQKAVSAMLDILSKRLDFSSVRSAITAEGMVREIVQAHRASGLARAFDIAARLCRLTARRVKSFFYGEVADWRASEDRSIRDGYAAWIDQHIRLLDAQQSLLRARLDALRQEQP